MAGVASNTPSLTIIYITYYIFSLLPLSLILFPFILPSFSILFFTSIFNVSIMFYFIFNFIINSIYIVVSISILSLFTLYCIILFYINTLFLLSISSILSILPFYCCMVNFLVYIASKNCSMRNFFFKTFVSITTFYYLCSRRYNINNTIYYIMTFITS